MLRSTIVVLALCLCVCVSSALSVSASYASQMTVTYYSDAACATSMFSADYPSQSENTDQSKSTTTVYVDPVNGPTCINTQMYSLPSALQSYGLLAFIRQQQNMPYSETVTLWSNTQCQNGAAVTYGTNTRGSCLTSRGGTGVTGIQSFKVVVSENDPYSAAPSMAMISAAVIAAPALAIALINLL